jgi:hypothetical protein
MGKLLAPIDVGRCISSPQLGLALLPAFFSTEDPEAAAIITFKYNYKNTNNFRTLPSVFGYTSSSPSELKERFG